MGPGPRHLKRSIKQLQLIEAGSASVKTLKTQFNILLKQTAVAREKR